MRLPVPQWLVDHLLARAMRTPYFHLDGYMKRWWLVPYVSPEAGPGCGPVKLWRRPLAWILQRFGIAVRIHHILRSDHDRAFHNHPWWFVSLILRGTYVEVRPNYLFEATNGQGPYVGDFGTTFFAGDVIQRRSEDFHRLKLDQGPALTLFITGPKTQSWGFMENPHLPDQVTNHKDYYVKIGDPFKQGGMS